MYILAIQIKQNTTNKPT